MDRDSIREAAADPDRSKDIQTEIPMTDKESKTRHTTNFRLRISNDLKSESERVFTELGMDLSVAIELFLRQCIITGGLPFKTSTPTQESPDAVRTADSD